MLNELIYLIAIITISFILMKISDSNKRSKERQSLLASMRFNMLQKLAPEVLYEGDLNGSFAIVCRDDKNGCWRYRFFLYETQCKVATNKLTEDGFICDWCEFIGDKVRYSNTLPHLKLEKLYGKPKKEKIPETIQQKVLKMSPSEFIANLDTIDCELLAMKLDAQEIQIIYDENLSLDDLKRLSNACAKCPKIYSYTRESIKEAIYNKLA